MFKEERTEKAFCWAMLGDIRQGRPNLGQTMDVAVYRLMQFTLRDVLIQELGVQKTDEIFYRAGKAAGEEFHANLITQKNDFGAFIKELQDLLLALKIGVLRVEEADTRQLVFTLTVEEDLDCSGLPMCDEVVCTYDEGFIDGLLSAHTGRSFTVKEVDCWASGDRICRFRAEARVD